MPERSCNIVSAVSGDIGSAGEGLRKAVAVAEASAGGVVGDSMLGPEESQVEDRNGAEITGGRTSDVVADAAKVGAEDAGPERWR